MCIKECDIFVFQFTFKISTNGYIMIDSGSRRIQFPRANYSVIAPYNLDLVAKNNIFQRTTTDKSILSRIDEYVSKARNDYSFQSTSALIVTFDSLNVYRSSSSQITFQVVFATNLNATYVIVNYHRLDYPAKFVGFYDGVCNKTKNISIGDSRMLTSTSNIGISGVHVYKLTLPKQKCSTSNGNYL